MQEVELEGLTYYSLSDSLGKFGTIPKVGLHKIRGPSSQKDVF